MFTVGNDLYVAYAAELDLSRVMELLVAHHGSP